MTDGLPRFRTGDETVDRALTDLLATAGVEVNRDLIFELMTSAVRMGREGVDRGDLKIANSTLKEMRYAFHVFAPYRDIRKVAMFGSARTPPEDAAYSEARAIGDAIAAVGWMVITGGGPGIMTAGVEGAGPENSFAVGIQLPFEPAGAAGLVGDGKSVNFRYFFNRKLTFMKESSGFVLLPGGFGTMDEAFELLTLLQTGRAVPAPVVLFEPTGDAYWRSFRHFLEVEILDAGLIRREDLDLFHMSSDVDDAVAYLSDFYRVFHSMRYIGGRLVIRLERQLTDHELTQLNELFADIIVSGDIERCDTAQVEIADDDAVSKPRIRFRFVNDRYARLHALIRTLNTFVSD